MTRKFNVLFRHIAVALCVLFAFQLPISLFAQSTVAGQQVELSPSQLDDLVAPIALYPDPLVSQILVAATYPVELAEAYQWLESHPALKGRAVTEAAEAQSWDPSIQALVMFPDVMKRLNEDAIWTTSLGNAFLAQQSDLMNAIQRMRLKAQQAGKLVSTSQQQVLTTTDGGQTVVTIMPTNPEVIYVPIYDPVWIWGPAVYSPYPRWYFAPYPSGLSFGLGVSVGSFLGGGWLGWAGWGWYPHWTSRTIVVNNSFIARYHFNSAHLVARTGTTVWVHDPLHGRGVPYPKSTLTERFRERIPENVRPGSGFGYFENRHGAARFHAGPGYFHAGPGGAGWHGHERR